MFKLKNVAKILALIYTFKYLPYWLSMQLTYLEPIIAKMYKIDNNELQLLIEYYINTLQNN